MRAAGPVRRPGAAPRAPAALAHLALLALALPRRGGVDAAAVWSRMFPLGDKGVHGEYGPSPRMGHVGVGVGERMFVFGGRSEFMNGDYLNDLWLYDWSTGNWTSYYPNELVCDECSVCNSVLANELPGHTFIKSDDDGAYVPCNPWDEEAYLAASANVRELGENPGSSCEYHTTCFDWTGLRPYAEPVLPVGVGRNTRQVPAGRYEHITEVVLNRASKQRDKFVVVGGYSVDCSDYCSDVWHYDVPRNAWTKVTNFTRPGPARRWKAASAVYEDIVFMFGGHGARLPPLGEGQEPVPNELYDHSSIMDPNNPLYLDDLWSYNATEREWTRLFPNCLTCTNRTEPDGTADRDPFGPRGRFGSVLVNHETHLYLFGGYAFGGPSRYQSLYPTATPDAYPSLATKYYLNDLWRYDIKRNTWEEIEPRKGYESRPSPRYGHSATLSQRRQHSVILIFGGRTWDDEIGDLWIYNISGNTFNKVEGEGEFPARRYASSIVSVGMSSLNTEGRALLLGGHGCYSGENYVAATKSKPLPNKPNPEYNNRWVQLHNDYGEKFCHHILADLWQYYPTSCPNDCSRKGICEYNVCVCEPGFTGADCSLVTCPGDVCEFDYLARKLNCFQCTGRGVCNGFTGECMCTFPAGGPSCNQYECLNDCNGNGVCDKTTANDQGYGTCICHTTQGRPAYTGIDCSVPVCPAQNVTISRGTCNGRGICVNGTCVCHPGFGDSFLHRIENKDTDDEKRIPVYLDGSDIPTNTLPNGKEVLADALIMVADCGDLAFTFAGAGRAACLFALAAFAAARAVL